MKRTLFVLLFVLIGVTACSSSEKPTLTDQKMLASSFGELPATIEMQNMKLEMVIEKPTYRKSDDIKLLIKNRGDTGIALETSYKLEFFNGGSWYEVPFAANIGFTMVGILLKPNSVHYDLIGLDNFKYDVTPGKYRIVKSFGVDGSHTSLGAEFYLK